MASVHSLNVGVAVVGPHEMYCDLSFRLGWAIASYTVVKRKQRGSVAEK